jgi:hypothetical protein
LPRRQIDESVRDALRRHISLHRPADDTAREQVDHGRHVKPAFGRPDVSEVRDPLLVRTLGDELAIQNVGRNQIDRPFAVILRRSTSARARPQSLGAHQPLDLVQAAGNAIGQHVPPDTAGALGSRTGDEAGPDLRH